MTPQDEKKEKTLKYSIKDGVFASLMSGFTADYFTPFLLLLGGTVKHVGILSALPNLISSIIQLKSADISERLGSRKKLINIFVFLQAFMLLPMMLSYGFGEARVSIFIAMVTLFTASGAFANPAWGSLMADLVKTDKRGEYFGWRNKILGFVSIVSTFVAGLILHQMQAINALWGFAILFGVAFIFRIVSWQYLRMMHEPELVHKKEDYFSFTDFVSRWRQSNFTRFVFFVSAMKFTVNIASPFFAVLMIRDLKFGYMTYTVITLAATLAANISIKRWGMHADKIGNLKVVKLTSRLIAFIPLVWVVNQSPGFLFMAQVFSGFAWAGFNLAASNFIYDSVTPGKRTRCISYFNAFNGLSLCLGALLGGFLAQQIPAGGLLEYGLMGIIILSAALRIVVAFFMPFNLKEVREVEKIRSHELFISMIRLRPVEEKAKARE